MSTFLIKKSYQNAQQFCKSSLLHNTLRHHKTMNEIDTRNNISIPNIQIHALSSINL